MKEQEEIFCFFVDERDYGNMKVSLMMEYKDGGSHKYETYEVSTIIDTPEEYLLILKEPKDGELIERVQKDIFHMIVE